MQQAQVDRPTEKPAMVQQVDTIEKMLREVQVNLSSIESAAERISNSAAKDGASQTVAPTPINLTLEMRLQQLQETANDVMRRSGAVAERFARLV